MQEQKYEACRSLEKEWEMRLEAKTKLFLEEKIQMEEEVKEIKNKLRSTNLQLNKRKLFI